MYVKPVPRTGPDGKTVFRPQPIRRNRAVILARDGAGIRTLAGTERMDALRKSQNRDADGKALFNDLLKNSSYAFEDQTPPPPPYAGGCPVA